MAAAATVSAVVLIPLTLWLIGPYFHQDRHGAQGCAFKRPVMHFTGPWWAAIVSTYSTFRDVLWQ